MPAIKRIYRRQAVLVEYYRHLPEIEVEDFINDPEKSKTWTERGILDLDNKIMVVTIPYFAFIREFPEQASEAEALMNNSLVELKKYDWNG